MDDEGKVVDRVTIDRITIRDAPPAEVEPFSTESVDELAHYRVVLETSAWSDYTRVLAGRRADARP